MSERTNPNIWLIMPLFLLGLVSNASGQIATNPTPADGSELDQKWVSLSWLAPRYAVQHLVYFGDNFADVEAGTGDTLQGQTTTTTFLVGLPGSPYPDGLVPGTTYYWRIDLVKAEGTIHKGDVWSFTIPPEIAYDPYPPDRAEFVDPDLTLSWTAGLNVTIHYVYFGDNFADVNDGTGDTYKGPVLNSTYTPDTLELGKVYYWRIDEFDGSVTHKGDVWSFTTGPVATEYYVATDGDDNNPGTKALSFKTIVRARDAIRYETRPMPDGGVTVWIRGGMYYLDEPLMFGPEDSGSDADRPICYQAYPGENPVISGGREITGWQRDESNQNLWRVTLPGVAAGTWWFRQLWCDNERCQRARWPNPGELLEIREVSPDFLTIRLNKSIPGSDLPVKGTELVVYHWWCVARGRIAKKSDSSVTTETVCGGVGLHWTEPQPVKPAFLEHHPEYIDQPTEWYLDPTSGVLTYQAPHGINPNNYIFVVPKLEKLIVIIGTRHAPVQNIIFKGLSFKHTGWNLPDIGYSGMQAGHYRDDVSHPQYVIPLAIEMSYADSCRVEKCCISNIGGSAIGFGAGCNNNGVIDCELYDIGGNGIMAGWLGDSMTGRVIYRASRDTPLHNTISNNYLHNIAGEWLGCVGIWEGYCKHTKIVHNTITNLPYTGVSTGWRWNSTPYVQEGVIVQQNHIYEVTKKFRDGGSIYTLGNHLGGLILGNVLHDVHEGWEVRYPPNNAGINFDQGSSNIHVEDNISYNTAGKAIHFYQCDSGDMTWGTNYWDSHPTGWGAIERAIAAAAGVVPTKPKDLTITLSDDGNNILVAGSCEPWAGIHTAKIQEDNYDVTDEITIKDNGSIHGMIPAISVSTNMVTLELVISDPEGDLSPPGVSNTLAF